MPKNVTFPKCIGYTWNKDFDQYRNTLIKYAKTY